MLDGQPEQVSYFDGKVKWALSVAENFVWYCHRDTAPNAALVDECWVDENFDLLLRYRRLNHRFGVLFGNLTIDNSTGFSFDSPGRRRTSTTSGEHATNIFYGGFDCGTETPLEWTDASGYQWWGDPSPTDWQTAVESVPRLGTVLRHASSTER